MPYNRPPPERQSRQPDRFYSTDQANAYHSEANGIIQKELTEMARSLLPPCLDTTPMLDLGCGSGLSTQHLPLHSVGIDVSLSMLQLAQASHARTQSSYVCGAAFSLPFRAQSFDRVVSISMLQWLSHSQLTRCLEEVARILTPHGSAIFQVYPFDAAHADEMLMAARGATNTTPVLVADFPHANRAVKWFLCMNASTSLPCAFGRDKCPLARRFDGTCAYRYRQRQGLHFGRLVHEHVQYAWHAYRKVVREMHLAAQSNALLDAALPIKSPSRHHKERQVFPNEERLVRKLVEALAKDDNAMKKLTLDDLRNNADTVVDLMHATLVPLASSTAGHQ
ncbi:hypothetical protein DYB32_002031 [Aphanomyces invadans]|uniref:Methyltransferase type 11 domain-containing protein n=1 Tax=Aphanomyces invadans TaxID=157072 RepID=A0A418B6A2_9STRA|nr:hypothetical protein DYB32_002031 [Aphanomyces invadans]